MNKYILLFFMTCTFLNALEWKSYEEALELQKQNKKMIMIDVVRTNCHYCESMEKDVFDDKMMGKWIEERFIPVKLNLNIVCT